MAFDVQAELLDQLVWHWDRQARPRLDGLTDEEYFWEPAEGCWNVRHRGTSHAPIAAGSGMFTIDFALPEPSPAPVTTIAWRLGHILVGVLGVRNAAYFGGPPVSYQEFDYPGAAGGALAVLDEYYGRWVQGVRSLRAEGLGRACGAAEGPFAERPMAALVLHINRELIHHLAEVALLRDLFAHRR
ncbi:DinB family protein [Arthrobacter sp. GCM10027362]|uniref:DinB family protein n=1 Tax=Arthrobacter sp. GCM10027362 TaxID=3273379 RepID=UPI003640644B